MALYTAKTKNTSTSNTPPKNHNEILGTWGLFGANYFGDIVFYTIFQATATTVNERSKKTTSA